MSSQRALHASSGCHPPVRNVLLVAAVLLLTLAGFFHLQLQNGWTLLFGDRTDGAIEVTILEHWFNVFRGVAKWNATNYFYPYTDTLGYNDGYLLYGVFYSLFRGCGIDPFLSAELVNVAVKAIGFVSFYAALRSILSVSVWSALLGSVLFTLSNNSYVQAHHVQLFSVAFAPLMTLVLFCAWTAFCRQAQWTAACWLIVAAILYGAWALTAFYMVWFFTFFSALALVIYAVCAPEALLVLWHVRRRLLVPGIVGSVALAFTLTPFVLVYLPKAAETGMHSFAAVLAFSPSIFDTVNVGPDNWLFGDMNQLLNRIIRPEMPLGGERASGLPPLAVLAFGVALLWLWLNLNRRLPHQVLVRSIAAAATLSWLLSLHYGSFTAWKWIYACVPGAAAVRGIARYQIFLVVPIMAVVVSWLDALSRRFGWPLMLVASTLLVSEEINFAWPVGLSPATEMARLTAVPPIPSSCSAFAAVNVRPGPLAASPSVDAIYSHNVDAMLIAEFIGVRTINGMSSFLPPDWDFANPAQDDYLSRIGAYLDRHRLHNVCLLDLATLTWQPFR